MNWRVLLLTLGCLAPGLLYANSQPAQPPSPEGNWKIEKVAGYADSALAGPDAEKKYIGQVLSVSHGNAKLGNDKGVVAPVKEWDTQSREWMDEFRTNPQDLKLPRRVKAYDLGFTQVILTGSDRLLLDLGGTWFAAKRSKRP